MKCKSLKEVMSYENIKLVQLYSRTKNISYEESKELFSELKKLLWFLAQRPNNSAPFGILTNQKILDDYWHEFILYTQSYTDFCNKYLGRYIHHYPYDTHDSLVNFVDKRYKDEYEKELLSKIRSQMEEVEQILGINTVYLWYVEYPRKYGRNKYDGR